MGTPTPIQQSANRLQRNLNDQATLLGSRPPPAPDLTDKAIHAAALQGLGPIGKGRKSTFLTGPMGA